MAERSARNKIKWQAGKIRLNIKQVFVHLQKIDELSQGRSSVINAHLSVLTGALTEYERAFNRFAVEL